MRATNRGYLYWSEGIEEACVVVVQDRDAVVEC